MLAASVLCVLLAVTADLLLLGLQRLLTPWTRISGTPRTPGTAGTDRRTDPDGPGGPAGLPAPAKVEAG